MGQVAYIVPNNVYQEDNSTKPLPEQSDNTVEIHLLQQVSNHDRRAFQDIFALYHPRLQRFISRFSHCQELVEEVINDVMFVVWQKATDFQHRSRVSTWIFGIAYNKTQSAIIKQSKHKTSDIDESPEQIDPTTPYSQLSQEQDLSQIQTALGSLSFEHQTVIVLTYIYGYSYPEISDVMSCPVNTVKTRMFHARKKMQELLPQFKTLSDLGGHDEY